MTQYAAVIVHFLDRETDTVKTMYLYPITKIECITFAAHRQMNFVVDEVGRWVPEIPPVNTGAVDA
jgi:hypothetical protein